MRFSGFRTLAILLGSVVAAGSAQAGSCGYQYCWGAVMINEVSGAWGFSHGYATEQQAYDRAMAECSYGCTQYRTFANACAAIALASNRYWGWGQGQSRYDAESTALGYCSEGAHDCQIQVWACSF